MNLIFAGNQINLRRQELRRNGELVHLEPQVYDLLVYLVRNRDRVVSKDDLIDTIWNGRIVSDAALSSRINAVRKGIGDDGDRQHLIKTIHRRGFRFVADVEEEPADPGAKQAPGLRQDSAQAGAPGLNRPEQATAAAPRKPSVAVLPFANFSGEPDTDYFSYGLTEDIIRLLARNSWLDVLSRHSAVAFQNRNADPREIGSALQVRYVVQGTVLRQSERVRITADLVSGETGHQLWWESYDVAFADILDVQTTMAQQIAAVIEPELARLEREAAVRRPPADLGAWDCYQRGLWHLWGFTTPGLVEAQAMFQRAIGLDPGFARAYGGLAYVVLQAAVLRDSEQRPAMLEEALRHGRSAVALDSQDCMNLCVVGRVLCFLHQYDEAIAYLEEALKVNPSFAQAYFALGFTLIASGRPGDALAHLDRAAELSPRDPHLASFLVTRALAHLSLNELDTGVIFARRAMRVPNTNQWSFATLATLLSLMGRVQEARRAAATLLDKFPDYDLMVARLDFFFCGDQRLVTRFLEGLQLAGVPESAGQRARS